MLAAFGVLEDAVAEDGVVGGGPYSSVGLGSFGRA